MLGDNSRALLLAKVIILQKRRYPAARFKYLTPFLVDQKNLQLRYAAIEPADYRVTESLKTERYYVVDCREGEAVNIYDQYFDRFLQCSEDVFSDELQLILNLAAKKNIIFFNLPAMRRAARAQTSLSQTCWPVPYVFGASGSGVSFTGIADLEDAAVAGRKEGQRLIVNSAPLCLELSEFTL